MILRKFTDNVQEKIMKYSGNFQEIFERSSGDVKIDIQEIFRRHTYKDTFRIDPGLVEENTFHTVLSGGVRMCFKRRPGCVDIQDTFSKC